MRPQMAIRGKVICRVENKAMRDRTAYASQTGWLSIRRRDSNRDSNGLLLPVALPAELRRHIPAVQDGEEAGTLRGSPHPHLALVSTPRVFTFCACAAERYTRRTLRI